MSRRKTGALLLVFHIVLLYGIQTIYNEAKKCHLRDSSDCGIVGYFK